MIPPLRERREEIPIFVEYFLDKYGKKYGRKVPPLSNKTMEAFSEHHWVGNVRELENVIQRLVVLGDEDTIIEELTPVTKEDPIPEKKKKMVPAKKIWPSLKEVHQEAIKKVESEMILKALEMTNWNRKKAADKLNISYKALLYKIKETSLDKRFIP
jgi:transcriptional regulator with PAS, ATPase and Fis domain